MSWVVRRPRDSSVQSHLGCRLPLGAIPLRWEALCRPIAHTRWPRRGLRRLANRVAAAIPQTCPGNTICLPLRSGEEPKNQDGKYSMTVPIPNRYRSRASDSGNRQHSRSTRTRHSSRLPRLSGTEARSQDAFQIHCPSRKAHRVDFQSHPRAGIPARPHRRHPWCQAGQAKLTGRAKGTGAKSPGKLRRRPGYGLGYRVLLPSREKVAGRRPVG